MSNSSNCFNQSLRAVPDLVANLAAENAKFHYSRHNGTGGGNAKYYKNYQTPYVPQMHGNFNQRQRFAPYPNRHPSQCTNQSNHLIPASANVNFGSNSGGAANKSLNSSLNSSGSDSGKNTTFYSTNSSGSSSNISQCSSSSTGSSSGAGSTTYNYSYGGAMQSTADQKEMVVLQISNLDPSIEEHKMHQYLLCQLKSITPVLSLTIESPSLAKVKVPSTQFAKLVVANLHRKKIGHKRMVVSYIKDPSSAESSALRCQVAGLLKDVPYYSLPINKFRELFQSRFKSSISVLDLYRMPDVCTITLDKNEEKYISLQPDVINSLQNNPLVESSQHSVPYCIYHFKQEKEKGWAEQEIEPLPNVMMSISQLQSVIYSLLKTHKDDIPVASILYCIENELQIKIVPNENGVPLEHLLCSIRGVQITNNNFGIKVLTWLDHELNSTKDNDDASSVNLRYMPKSPNNDFLQQISREVVELIKMSPKSTMKFTRFIPAYHNHFGKQCRVADYGYTRLIELFEALSPVVQVMGDGENRHITLTHRTQIRRFTCDLLKILRGQANKSILLSQLPIIFSQAQNRIFDVTDYGVCDIFDIIDGLVYNNSIVTKVYNETDVLISMVKRKQSPTEVEKTCIFAGEVVELFKNAPQYSILFKKFVRSYHYHFGYQCRLSDYGLMKLADLLEAISGIVEMEQSNDEDRKIFLNHRVAIRIFAEQVQDIVKHFTSTSASMILMSEILNFHKNKYGYQIQPYSLGYSNMVDAIKALPYMEIFESGNDFVVVSRLDDPAFRLRAYAACLCLLDFNKERMPISDFLRSYLAKFNRRDCYRLGCLTADGFERGVMSINRQIPGPAIQVCKDDLIVVDMTNAMGGTATTMHWHGLHQRDTPHMDGVPFVTQCPVEFMSTFRYAFWATEPGTQFYHSHAGHHKVNGHYGAMIIREPEANDPNADLYDFDLPEHLIVASDWMHVDGEMYMPGLPNGDGILPVNVLINGRGTWQKDADSNRTDVPREVYRVRKGGRYRFRFINAASHVCPLELQIANHTLEIIASDSYNLQPITVNTLVATSGERYDFVVSADQPSDDYWIRVRAIGPCDYRKISQGAVLSYRPMSVPVDDIAFPDQGLPDFHEPLFPEVHSVNHPNTTCGVSQPDVCVTDFEAYETEDGIINGIPDRQFILGFENYPMRFEDAFGVGQHEHFMNIHDDIVLQGAINNISFTYPPFSLLTQPELVTEDMFCDEDRWPERCQSSDHCTCIHRLKIPLNALIELYILDLTPEVNDLNHPFHLHGYQMYVMEMGQDRQKPITMERAQQIALRQSMQRIRMTTMPPKKDTVSVPSKGYTRVRFLADNPGFWLMHCHYEWHTAVGMVLVLQVGEPDSFVQPPSGFPTCNKYTPDVDASLFV